MDSELDIERLIDEQREFQENFFDPDSMTMDERQEWTEQFVLHMTDQSHSLLGELDWKEHTTSGPVEYDQVVEEMVDILKYWANIAVVLNVQPQEIAEKFEERTTEVEERYEREMQ